MPAYLIATQRHSHLQPEYELAEGRTRVGRHPENEIALMLESISRFHAEIVKQGNFYLLEDCQSRNGTYLNGDRLTAPCPIRQGDRIQFGNVEFIFRLSSLEEPSAPSAIDTNVSLATRPTRHSVLHSHKIDDVAMELAVAGQNPEDPRLSQRVSVLYQILLYLRQHDVEESETLREVLRRLFTLMPAERSAILVRGNDGAMTPLTWLRREETRQHTSPNIVISQSICEQAIRQQSAVLVGDTKADERFRASESVATECISSAICVPLMSGEKVFGLLYLDTQDPANALGTDDLRVAGTVASEISWAIWTQHDENTSNASSAAGGHVADIMLATARTFEKLLHDASQYGDTLHEALQKNDLTSAQGSWKQIRAGIKRLNKLLAEMTEYGAPASPRLADVDVNRVMRETLDAFKDEMRRARIQGRLELQENLEPRKLDEEFLYKALLNLVENAYEALLGQGGTITLKSYETPQGALILEVIDDGPGLAPQTLTRAFQPFNAGPGSRGVGMGLAMTRRLLEAMDGSATLSSEQGRGTTVTLILPPTTRL